MAHVKALTVLFVPSSTDSGRVAQCQCECVSVCERESVCVWEGGVRTLRSSSLASACRKSAAPPPCAPSERETRLRVLREREARERHPALRPHQSGPLSARSRYTWTALQGYLSHKKLPFLGTCNCPMPFALCSSLGERSFF